MSYKDYMNFDLKKSNKDFGKSKFNLQVKETQMELYHQFILEAKSLIEFLVVTLLISVLQALQNYLLDLFQIKEKTRLLMSDEDVLPILTLTKNSNECNG